MRKQIEICEKLFINLVYAFSWLDCQTYEGEKDDLLVSVKKRLELEENIASLLRQIDELECNTENKKVTISEKLYLDIIDVFSWLDCGSYAEPNESLLLSIRGQLEHICID